MFDIDEASRRRYRAIFEPGPTGAVVAMCYGRQQYRHEPQAVKPASRHVVKPWSDAAMPNQRDAAHAARKVLKPKVSAKQALLAARAAHVASKGN
jgi:hypothetical protein